MTKKILFLDRDGTLIAEPPDQQVDSIEKLTFISNVIPALLEFKKAGFYFVMVTNQDGLGTTSFPEKNFLIPHEFLLNIFASQGIIFEEVLICPHFLQDNCECRKPKLGLLLNYLRERNFDRDHSYVIGDRDSDLELAKNMGIVGFKLGDAITPDWKSITSAILQKSRTASFERKTLETDVKICINLDLADQTSIKTPFGFFSHMLEQLAKHGGFSLNLQVLGDSYVDDHHIVEDTALALGSTMRIALGDKLGINRYGFLLPMDDALTQVAIDLSGRSYLHFDGLFNREKIGDFSTELVSHFFRSFSDGLQANLNIKFSGTNCHHMIESIFKATGRALKQAIQKNGVSIPSTKGVL